MARKPRARKLPVGIRWYKNAYQVRYYDDSGVRKGRSFDRLEAAKQFQRSLAKRRSASSPTADGSIPTFDVWARIWLEGRLRQKARSREKNYSIIELHLIGDARHGFGKRPLSSIRQPEVQAWVNWMARHYKPSYVRSAYAVLGGILRAACAADYLVKPPLYGVQLPPQ
jgi:hypothetical protein